MRDRNGVDPDGRGGEEEPGGVDGREIVLRLNCMRKEIMFNKRNKNTGKGKTILYYWDRCAAFA